MVVVMLGSEVVIGCRGQIGRSSAKSALHGFFASLHFAHLAGESRVFGILLGQITLTAYDAPKCCSAEACRVAKDLAALALANEVAFSKFIYFLI
jgi:hypothetical protein